MITPTNPTSSSHYRKRDIVLDRDSDDQEVLEEIDEETVNKQIAKSVCCYPLLSSDVLSILLKERIKTQEYQPVTDLVIFDLDEANNLITFV